MEGVIKKFIPVGGRCFKNAHEEFLTRGETRFGLLYILIVGPSIMT